MSDQNVAFFTGRLTRSPEVKTLTTGNDVANFSLAVNEYWTKDGEKQEKVVFVDFDVWGTLVNFVSNHLDKGDFVRVSARYNPGVTENENGKRVFPRFRVNELQKLAWKDKVEGDENTATTTKVKAGRPRKTKAETDDSDSDIPF